MKNPFVYFTDQTSRILRMTVRSTPTFDLLETCQQTLVSQLWGILMNYLRMSGVKQAFSCYGDGIYSIHYLNKR